MEISIVEDDAIIRESLAILINGTPGLKCISSYSNAETAIKGTLENPPDIVLLDITLPGMNGIDGMRKIRSENPEIDFLILTIHEDRDLVFDALCAGASGYLVKDTPSGEILESIHDCYRGGAPMSSKIARMVVNSFHVSPKVSLTDREKQVLANLCEGKTYKMIAAALFVSEGTVHFHIKNIYKKLEVNSKSEAVAKALTEKLV
ncbi:MAG: DNA-binding response regulator [Calditrichaeota bacterium]|nr:MAG: DNA-binding response regulator [Calditrichota bacterium]